MRVMATGVLALLLGGPVLAQTLDGAALVRADERVWQEEHRRWRQENRDVADRLERLASLMRRAESGPMAHERGLPSLDAMLEDAMLQRGAARAAALDSVAMIHARMRAAHEETRHAHGRILELLTALEAAVESERLSEEGERAARGGGARP
jgi:hypothetical protein